MTIRIVDVSHHQGSISPSTWKSWKTRWGLTGAMVKVIEGLTFTDPEWAANRAGIDAAGLVFGGYDYARPGDSTGATQARRLASIMKPRPGDFVCLDLEKSDGLTQAELNAWMIDFGDTMAALCPSSGVYLGGYSSNGSGRNASQHFKWWMYPRYASMNPSTSWPPSCSPRLDGNTTGWPAPHIWQWTPALPPGIDASVSSLTAAELAHPSTPTGGDLTLSASQFDQLMAAISAAPHDVWAYDQNGARQQAWAYQIQAAGFWSAYSASVPELVTQVAAASAAAVLAQLPPGQGGPAPTVAELGDEFERRLRAVFGSLEQAATS